MIRFSLLLTHLGYPTPVKPDQPTLAPFGKRSIRSEVLANFFSIEGRRTRLLSKAEAVIDDMVAVLNANGYPASSEVDAGTAGMGLRWSDLVSGFSYLRDYIGDRGTFDC